MVSSETLNGGLELSALSPFARTTLLSKQHEVLFDTIWQFCSLVVNKEQV